LYLSHAFRVLNIRLSGCRRMECERDVLMVAPPG
jgi:hypothetical protein